MDRQLNEVDDGSKNQLTSSTVQEGNSCPPATPPSVAVPKEEVKKEEPSIASFSSCSTKTTVGGDSNVGKAAAVNNIAIQNEKPPVVSVGEAVTTCGISTTTTVQLTTQTRKDDGKIENKVEISIPPSTTDITTAMSDQSITTTCSQNDNTTSISVSSTTYNTNSSKTVNNRDFSCTEKVLDESIKDNVNKSGISSSQMCTLQPNQQQVKGNISNDGENSLVVGSNSESSAVVSTSTTTTNSNNDNSETNVKMTSRIADIDKKGGENKTDSQQQQHGPILDAQVSCNVSEEKNPPPSVSEEMQNQPEKTATSSSIVANKDAGGRKEDTQPEETTCPEQPPKRLVSGSNIHLSEYEGNVICSNNNDDDQQGKCFNDYDNSYSVFFSVSFFDFIFCFFYIASKKCFKQHLRVWI